MKPRTLASHPAGRALPLLLPLLTVLYLILIGGNIAYPLLWADESMTAMHARRVLEFGYPKVHDGKNVLYDLENVDMTLGVDPATDAYIGGPGWTQYYFAAPFVAVAEKVTDPYGRTAIVRGAFALAGSIGLLLYLLAALPALPSGTGRITASCYYILACCCSVPLLLHLREARYYSLTFLILGALLFTYSRSRLAVAPGGRCMATALALELVLLFLTFAPAFFITICAMVAYEILVLAGTPPPLGTQRFSRARLQEVVRRCAPLAAAVVLVVPLAAYFRTFAISSAVAAGNNYSIGTYLTNLQMVVSFLLVRDKLAVVLVLQIAVALCRWRNKCRVNGSGFKDRLSRFCMLLLVSYLLLVPAISSFYLFDRYFIYLQPLLTVMVIIDTSLLWEVAMGGKEAGKRSLVALAALAFCSLAVTVISDRQLLEGKVQEAFRQYRGTLDFIIPLIAANVTDPSRLTIATNYEETSYMYYLNSKTTIGFVGNNLADDLRQTPDLIILRGKNFSYIQNPAALVEQLTKNASYRSFSLPVYDAPYNTIPQTDRHFPHPFTTVDPKSEADKLLVFVREDPALKSLANRFALMTSL